MSDPKWRYARWIKSYVSDAKYYIHTAKLNHINYDMYWNRSHQEIKVKYETYTINKILNIIEYLKILW